VLQPTSKWRAEGAVKRHELTVEERQLLALLRHADGL
jgi:hypothetical protein